MKLQEYWEKNLIPGINGITFKDGKVLLYLDGDCRKPVPFKFEETTLLREGKGYSFEDIGREFDAYVEVIHIESQGSVICGECEMGDQGFVLFKDNNNIVIWSLFQNFANPFLNDLRIENNIIYVTTEIQYCFKIPIYNPEKLSCISKNIWGY